MAEKKLIDLYPYKITNQQPRFLLFKRAEGHIYEGQWRMIGGKVETGETYWQAALRELDEETGISPSLFWTVPSVNQFYEHKTDTILTIPAFAAEISENEEIVLDSEHSKFDWFPVQKAVDVIIWPEQRRLLKLVHHIVTSNQILDDWLISNI
jgi:dihydroneopterin triphosphate diphosphatase